MSGFMTVTGLVRASQDPDIKYFDSGTVKATLDVVYSNKYTTKNGEKKEDSYFIKCSAWGKTAEIIGNYIQKGHLFSLEGNLITETWVDSQTGKNRSKMLVSINRVHLLPNNKNGDSEESFDNANSAKLADTLKGEQIKNQVQKEQISTEYLDDLDENLSDIPF